MNMISTNSSLITNTPVYEIYLDLDGVMFQFMKKATQITGLTEVDINSSKEAKKRFWSCIHAHVRGGHKFFEDLELFDDALLLWNYVDKYNHTVCSATGHMPNVEHEKRNTVRKYFGDNAANKAIFVPTSKDKAIYASQTSILIDDRSKSINPWVEAGGIGILHTNARDTITQLQELGLH